ncbi:rCG40935, partial [Rattus norvegicus]
CHDILRHRLLPPLNL